MIQLRLHSVNVLQRCFGLTPIIVKVASMIKASRTPEEQYPHFEFANTAPVESPTLKK